MISEFPLFVLAPVAHVALGFMARPGDKNWAALAAAVCVIVGVAIARFAFYAAYVG